MEILQLTYFLDVAETQHVTHSARRLHVAQPAITQAIRLPGGGIGGAPVRPAGKGHSIDGIRAGIFRDKLLPLAQEFRRLPEEMHTMANLENATIHLNVLAGFLTGDGRL